MCRLTLFQEKKDALGLNFATGCDEFKITCDPFFGRTGSSRLFYDRCYDVLYIGKLKRGGSRITMSLEKRDGKDFAVLKSEWAHVRTKGMKEWIGPGFTSRPLLLSFDCGPSCFFLDNEELDFERLLAGGTKVGIAARTRASSARQDGSIKTSPRSTPNVEGSQHMAPIDDGVLSSAEIRNMGDDSVAPELSQQKSRPEYSAASFELHPARKSPNGSATPQPAPVAEMVIDTQSDNPYQQEVTTSQPAPVAQMMVDASGNTPRVSRNTEHQGQLIQPSLSPPAKRPCSESGVTLRSGRQFTSARDAKRQRRYEQGKQRGVSDTESSDAESFGAESSDYYSATSDED